MFASAVVVNELQINARVLHAWQMCLSLLKHQTLESQLLQWKGSALSVPMADLNLPGLAVIPCTGSIGASQGKRPIGKGDSWLGEGDGGGNEASLFSAWAPS